MANSSSAERKVVTVNTHIMAGAFLARSTKNWGTLAATPPAAGFTGPPLCTEFSDIPLPFPLAIARAAPDDPLLCVSAQTVSTWPTFGTTTLWPDISATNLSAVGSSIPGKVP